MTHLLVTNDYPPKIGGIQSYLWELWRRLPPGRTSVLTIDHRRRRRVRRRGAASRSNGSRSGCSCRHGGSRPVSSARRASGALRSSCSTRRSRSASSGRDWALPYAVVLHGAEVTVAARLPVTSRLLRRVLVGADLVIAAGGYPADEARRLAGENLPNVVIVPPGVDVDRFQPLVAGEVGAVRRRFGLPEAGRLVVAVSRLVPRKGFDVLIEATAVRPSERRTSPSAVAGAGRDARRLESLAKRPRRTGRVPRSGERCRPAGPCRGRRMSRRCSAAQLGRAGAGGIRDRLPRGGRGRGAPGRRPQRRLARGGGRRRDRPRRRPARRCRRRRPGAGRLCSTTRRCVAVSARRRGGGRSPSSTMTSSATRLDAALAAAEG